MPLSLGQSIEKTQCRAALICTGAYRHTETQILLRELGWQTLTDRHDIDKLILFHKIIHGVYPEYLKTLIPDKQPSRYTLRHTHHIPQVKSYLKSMANSYIPSTVRAWNSLQQALEDAESSTHLKHKLTPAVSNTLKYHT